MKRQMLKTAGTAVMVLMASTGVVLADQARPRSPGSEGSSGGSSGSGGSGRSGGSDTGRVAMPRGGGSSDGGGGGGSVSSQPTRPMSGGTGTRTRGGRGGDDGSVASSGVVPGYSRPRDGASVTGRAVPRATVGALPPIISGPIYWGAGDSWYFYPWGYGGLGLGYLWDPWAWGGYGGAWGAGYPGYGYGGYGGYGGYSGYTGYESSGSGGYSSSSRVQNPDVTGSVRLKVTPRLAEVHVDGYFAGRVDDFDGAFQKLKLPPGPHRIELKANGFETLAFDVLVVEDEVTTYRGDLKPTR